MNINVNPIVSFTSEERELLTVCDYLRLAELGVNEYADTFGAPELAFQEGAYGEAQAARFEILEQICRRVDDLILPDWDGILDRVKVHIEDLAPDEILGSHAATLVRVIKDMIAEVYMP